MKIDVLMPRIGANDNYVTLCSWNVKEGEKVQKGQVLAQIETTKESGEIEAEENGYIHILANEMSAIPVGDCVCIISEAYDASQTKEKVLSADLPTVSKKAQALIEQYAINMDVFLGMSIVKEKDVWAYIEKTQEEEEASDTDECTLDNHIIINGAGGMCKVVLEILAQRGEYKVDGILEKYYREGVYIKNIPVISTNDEEALLKLYRDGYRYMINAIAFDRNKHDRKAPFLLMKKCGFKMINVIHNRAIIEPSVSMGEGNYVAAGAMLGTDVVLKNNCMINAGTIISHDCVIGSHSHIASGTVLGGGVIVGENTLIGQGCTVFKGVSIGKNVIIANGMHIFENVPDDTVIK